MTKSNQIHLPHHTLTSFYPSTTLPILHPNLPILIIHLQLHLYHLIIPTHSPTRPTPQKTSETSTLLKNHQSHLTYLKNYLKNLTILPTYKKSSNPSKTI